MNRKTLAKYLDSTLLNNASSLKDIENLCFEAIKYGFKAICINPYFVKNAKAILQNSDINICTVIGFPLGMNTLETKIYETQNAIDDGANEIDMVINIAELKKMNKEYCLNEINTIKQACGGAILKVIVETSQLTNDEKTFAAQLIKESNADFIKTSSGFVGSGANLEDIKNWDLILNGSKEIKAAGGIRDLKTCLEFIQSGATRIGTSKALEIITALEE